MRHYNIIAKPAAARCNLRCGYCFYLDKGAQFGPGASHRMSDATLASFVEQHIAASPPGPVLFAWQGGEPTLLGVDWFRRVVELQQQFSAVRQIDNTLQTNGTLLDDEWGQFLHANRFLVGISIDGPRDLHDSQRVDAKRAGSWSGVMRGIEVLKRHGVEFNTLTCVGSHSAGRGAEVYRFLKRAGSTYLQFIPLVGQAPGRTDPWEVSGPAWGRFLLDVFDHWVRHDVGAVQVQLFEGWIGALLGAPGGLCVHAPTCGGCLALEHDGALYACDHYVSPEWRLGSLHDEPLAHIVDGRRAMEFGAAKRNTLDDGCLRCRWLMLCNGGCPKDRAPLGADLRRNRLCAGYTLFFERAAPALMTIVSLLRSGRPASDVMSAAKTWPRL